MRLYFVTSPSHRVLRDEWFIPTLRDDFDLVEAEVPQDCQTGEYMTDGWAEAMIRKCDLVLKAIRENEEKVFLYSDVDVQFFDRTEQSIRSIVAGHDLLIQRNDPSGKPCPGFFACVGNERTKKLWTDVRGAIASGAFPCDQTAIHHLLRQGADSIRWSLLPDVFFCGGLLTGRRWSPGTPLAVPDGMLLHHANWTVGMEGKLAQLAHVRAIVGRTRALSVSLAAC